MMQVNRLMGLESEDLLLSKDSTGVPYNTLHQINHLPLTSKGGFDYFARSLAQGNYRLKDEDFPPLIFQNQGADDRRAYDEKRSHY